MDEEGLIFLSEETGGSRHIDNYGGLVGALRSMANTLTSRFPVLPVRPVTTIPLDSV